MNSLDTRILEQMGLHPERIREHQRRIVLALKGEIDTHIPVEEECSLENGALLPLERMRSALKPELRAASEAWQRSHMGSLIPAAGAASRHFKDVLAFIKTVDEEGEQAGAKTKAYAGLERWATVFEQHLQLKAADAYRELLSGHKPVSRAYAAAQALMSVFGSEPKALVQTTTEGDDFLDLKILEQERVFPVAKNFLIVSAGREQDFRRILAEKTKQLNASSPWLTTEQGLDLSTIRFRADGAPVFSEDGKHYSLVSAGHGELVHVMARVADQHPDIECLHVRNVDNVIGTSEAVQKTMNTLSQGFFQIVHALNTLRRQCASELTTLATTSMVESVMDLANFAEVAIEPADVKHDWREALRRVGEKLFGWLRSDGSDLSGALARPLSVMAMITRDPADVGGGPVFVRLQNKRFKMCLETPHANKQDAETFFSDKGRMKHFNPGFVFHEVRNVASNKPLDSKELYDSRFWLLSKKEFQGEPVYYHETVLYELVGNATRNNVMFIDVPRHVFHPHKSVFDSLEQTRKAYGF